MSVQYFFRTAFATKVISFLLVILLVMPGGMLQPKRSEGLVITATVVLLSLTAGMVIGFGTGVAKERAKMGGYPDDPDERKLFWLNVTESTLVGGMWGLGGLAFGVLGYAGASALGGGALTAKAVYIGIPKLTDVAVTSVDVSNAVADVNEKQSIMIEQAVDDFLADNPHLTDSDVEEIIANPDAFLVPYFRTADGYEEYVLAVETMRQAFGDELENHGLPRDVFEDLAILTHGMIVDEASGQPVKAVYDNTGLSFRHTVDPSYTELDGNAHDISVGLMWQVYNYDTEAWVYIDQKGYSEHRSTWPDPITFTSRTVTGSALKQLAGMAEDDGRPLYVAPSWSVTVDSTTRYSANLSDYVPSNGVLDDTPLTLSLKVRPPCTFTVSSPASDASYEIGDMPTISWASGCTDSGDNVKIDLYRNGSWSTIIPSTPNDGATSEWVVSGNIASDCKIRVTSIERNEIVGESGTFSITNYCDGHDLSVDFVEATNSSIKFDGTTTIKANVKNLGASTESNVTVTLSVSGPNYTTYKQTQSVNLAAAGQANDGIQVSFSWPPSTARPSTTGQYTASIQAVSSAGCDEAGNDNMGTVGIYASDDGSAPPVQAYTFKKYYLNNIGDYADAAGKRFTLLAQSENGDYQLSITGEGTDWYDDGKSYLSNDNSVIWWQHSYGFTSSSDGYVHLVIGESDNSSGFSSYSVTVPQGDIATYTASESYDYSEAYRASGSPEDGLRLYPDDESDLNFTEDGTTVKINTTNLSTGTYRFGILSDSPSSSRYEYLAFGRLTVVTPMRTLTITKTGAGTGQVTVNGSSYSLPFSSSFAAGTNITIEANEGSDSIFAGWTGAFSSSNANESFTLDNDTNLSVAFDRRHTLSVDAGGSGSGSVKINNSAYTLGTDLAVTDGQTVSLEAIPATGSVFTGWSGDIAGSSNPVSFDIGESKSIVANFQQTHDLTITYTGSGTTYVNGSAVASGSPLSFAEGEEVVIQFSPDINHVLSSLGGALSGTALRHTLTMDTDVNISAVFTSEEYTLTTSTVAGNGTISATPDPGSNGKYTVGTVVTLTATPNTGYEFQSWSGDASSSEPTVQIAMTANKSVTAQFAQAGSLGAALDNDSLTWTTGGDASWFSQEDQVYASGSAAQSGAIENGQTSWLQTSVTGPGLFTFMVRSSTELNNDKLTVWFNGSSMYETSGTADWSQGKVLISSGVEKEIRWSYTKDGANSAGSDCIWLDAVTWTPFDSETDTDSDGLPDIWEVQYFDSLAQTADGDPDNDGYLNQQEFDNDTDPTVFDEQSGGKPVIAPVLSLLLTDEPETGGKLVFTSDMAGEADVWSGELTADGTLANLVNLTADLASNCSGPKWSPDGTKIAFYRENAIWTMSADGSNKTQITNNDHDDISPAWSPDGTRIAFSRMDGRGTCSGFSTARIAIMNADGTGCTENDNVSGHGLYDPAWSPDGTRIVYSRDESTCSNPYDLFIMDINGDNRTRLYPASGDWEYQRLAIWGTHGKIMFSNHDFNGANDFVALINPDGSGLTTYKHDDQTALRGSCFAFDDTKIVYAVKTATEGFQLYMIDSGFGTTPVKLTDFGSNWAQQADFHPAQ